MIVEPVPASPRSPLRRAAGWVALALPVVLLGAVVAGGVIGGSPDKRTDRADRAAVPVTPMPEPSGATTLPSPAAEPVALATGPAYPTVVADLGVRTVHEALERRPRLARDRFLAVAGWLGVATAPDACPGEPPGGLGPLCERSGILVERPWVTSGGGVFIPIGVHLHPRFPVGVRLPPAIARTTHEAGGGPVPVVLVGRFEPGGGACEPVEPTCEVAFLVDQVAWVDGTAFPATPVVDAGVDTFPRDWILVHRDDAEVAAVGWHGTVLVSALLRPETVADVDLTAGRALETAPPAEGLVWYVRGLETDYDPTRYPLGQSPPRLRWIVLDDVTGEVLADGGPASTTP